MTAAQSWTDAGKGGYPRRSPALHKHGPPPPRGPQASSLPQDSLTAMAKFRGHFVVLAFILGAIFTPGDPYTQFGMAVPMVLLYEVGIWTSRLAARKVQARTEELQAS